MKRNLGLEALGFEPSNDNGGGDGMDPWQTSVEKRLDSLDTRMGRVDSIGLGMGKEKTYTGRKKSLH